MEQLISTYTIARWLIADIFQRQITFPECNLLKGINHFYKVKWYLSGRIWRLVCLQIFSNICYFYTWKKTRVLCAWNSSRQEYFLPINLASFETEDSFNAFGGLSRIYWGLKNGFFFLISVSKWWFIYYYHHIFYFKISSFNKRKESRFPFEKWGKCRFFLYFIDEETVNCQILAMVQGKIGNLSGLSLILSKMSLM